MTIGMREVTAPFEIVQEERGLSCTRIFIYDPDDTVDYSVELPFIGDVWVPPFSPFFGNNIKSIGTLDGFVCRRRRLSYLGAHTKKEQFECTYTNEPVDQSQFGATGSGFIPTNPAELPVSFEFAGEFNNINPATNTATNWKWLDNNTPVQQPISYRVPTINMKVTRVVFDSYYGLFTTRVRETAGKVNQLINTGNNLEPLFGLGEHNWLFISCNTEPFRDYDDIKKWRAELIFQFRDPDGSLTDGWNKILRIKDGLWEMPSKDGSTKLYEDADFNNLFHETLMP